MGNELSNEQVVAIKKVIADKLFDSAKGSLGQGSEAEVELCLIVKGRVKKGVDSTTPSWAKAKYDLLAGICLSHVNEATRNSIIREYTEVVKNHDSAEEKAVAVAEEFKAGVEAALKEVLGATEVVRKGTVTFKGDYRLVDMAVLESIL